eukprot:comp23985_c1_seq2/m.42595 comp23985_c1_seq2/g.42595  ORF comp23985_c1_seq2/g.42595 comp23985_c1_seq2/m.42595 type:complete len:758 (-) comp23985_c1_seq2:117-2390(-)
MARFAALFLAVLGGASSAHAAARGGASDADALRFAFSGSTDAAAFAKSLKESTGLVWSIVSAKTDTEAVKMVLDGNAEIAFPDSSAMLGVEKSLQGLVAEVTDVNGRTYYVASAYVKKGSGINTFADLKGKRSCHTGLQKSAGTYMPIGYGVRNGFIENHQESLAGTIRNYFTAGSCAAPALCGICKTLKTDGECTAEDPYSDYDGALQCLSEGAGDVAFVRDTTPMTECGGTDKKPWCLALDQYIKVTEFGNVPAHAIVSKPGAITDGAASAIKKGLTGLNASSNAVSLAFFGKNVQTFKEIPTAEVHMRDYSTNLGCVPEIEKFMGLSTPLPCAADKNPSTAPGQTAGARTGTAESPVRWAYPGQGQAAEVKELLQAKTGLIFQVVAAKNDQDAVAKVVAGEADLAAPDTVAAVQKMLQLEFVLAETLGSGRSYYNAVSYVRKDSGITSVDQLKGKKSCHTGFAKSAGMYVPIGHMIRTGKVEVKGNLKETVRSHFSAGQCAIPELCSACQANKTDGTCTTADQYSNYGGALRCLSEGAGDVAFAKDSTWDDICNVATKPSWCLDKSAYVALDTTGKVPSHPVVTKPGAIDVAALEKIKAAFEKITPSTDLDKRFLKLVAEGGAQGYARGTTLQAHTAEYMENLACIPDASNLLSINSMPSCQKTSTGSSGASSSQTSATGSSNDDYNATTRSIAVAALVLVLLAIVFMPIAMFFIARRQALKWAAQSQMQHQRQKDVDSESFNGQQNIPLNGRA